MIPSFVEKCPSSTSSHAF